MIRWFLIMTTLLFSLGTLAATRTISVTGTGSDSSYCNANSGSFCIDNIKRRADYNAERDAQWRCEMNERGRARTYTSFCYSYCSPSYLPPNHDGTFVSCRSDCRMDCEVDN